MTNLTDLLPAGAGGKQVSFTADGSISQGNAVALTSAGKAKAISSTGNPASLGSPVDMAGYAFKTYGVDITYDSANDKVVAVYFKDSDADGYAVVGSYSGTTITWGTPVKFYTGTGDGQPKVEYDTSAGKVLIIYGNTANSYLYGIVGTVSGTSISFGTATAMVSAWGRFPETTYDSANGKVIIAYMHQSIATGEAKIATISGTSVSFSSAATVSSGGNVQIEGCAYDSNAAAFAVLYNDNGNQTDVRVGTSDGSSITFGSETNMDPDGITAGDCSYDSVNQKIVFVHRDNGDTYLKARVGTLTGGSTRSVSFGASVTVEGSAVSGNKTSLKCAFNGGSTTILYTLSSDNYQRYINGTVSGTSISFDTAARYYSDNATSYRSAICTMSGSNVGIVFVPSQTVGSLVINYGYGLIYTAVGSNVADFIGIADAAISDTASGKITIKGGVASKGLSSLTIGSTYYVQSDGSLSTVSSSVTAGKALSATSINLDYST